MHEKSLFKSELAELGEYKVGPSDAAFNQAGCLIAPTMVFPKTSIWIEHDGAEPFVSDPTLINFYNLHQVYRRNLISERGDYCHWFRLDDELLSEITRVEKNHFKLKSISCPADIFMLHLQILHAFNNKTELDVLTLEEGILEIYHRLFSDESGSHRLFDRKGVKHQILVEQVKSTLNDDLLTKYSLNDLARIHNKSPYHLSRVFKKFTGIGINQYRYKQRLHQLTIDMQSCTKELTALALDFGFSSHSHMSASFKAKFGLTPSEFRAKISSH